MEGTLMAFVILISVASPKMTAQAAPNEMAQAALGVGCLALSGCD